MKNKNVSSLLIIILLLVACVPQGIPVTGGTKQTPTRAATQTRISPPATHTRTATPPASLTLDSVTIEVTIAPSETETETAAPATSTNTPGANTGPFRDAPACPTHDATKWHSLWDSARACHYDHEHGSNPFTPAVTATFPGFNLRELLGGVDEICHTNPSSPMECSHKHGGHKYDVMLSNPHGCLAGFESADWCVLAAVIKYHAFGNYAEEMKARIHSTVALLKIGNPANPNDYAIIYTAGLQEYGQRVSPYQGTVIFTIAQGCTVDNACPVNPDPPYDKARGPYNTILCVFGGLPGCRTSLTQALNYNADSKWTSKPTGTGIRPEGCKLFCLLFDVRDTYQLFDSRDLTYPFTFLWLCSRDGGVTYAAIVGCRYNNSTTHVNEVNGKINPAWDNLIGFDTNPIIGRITGEGFTDKFGSVIFGTSCTVAGDGCYPIKLWNVPVLSYGDYLTQFKASNNNKDNTPERDICFTSGGVYISCDLPGAISAGWIGADN